MSRSKPLKPLSGDKTKPKSKPSAARKKPVSAVETLRVIEAPIAPGLPAVELSAAERELSERAKAVAADIERLAKAGAGAVLDPAAVQAVIAAMCKVYSAHIESGAHYEAFSQRNPVTPTDVMVTASGLLKAANLAVFELGMWQSWTGR